MNYEEFKKTVEKELKNYLPEELKKMHCEVKSIDKINRTVDAITFTPIDKKEANVSPVIYINDMYDYYNNCNDLDLVLQEFAQSLEEGMLKVDCCSIPELENFKNNVVFQFINTEQNKELLSKVPHREILDLSIIYRWVVDINENNIQSAIVKNPLIESLNLNEQQLFNLAVDNTKRLFTPSVKNLNEVMRDILIKQNAPSEVIDELTNLPITIEQTVWVISNDRGVNGAINIMYEDVLHDLSNKLNSNLYIMPSSVHECIAVSANYYEPEHLISMVPEVNATEVLPEEILSDRVYYYDRKTKKITFVKTK